MCLACVWRTSRNEPRNEMAFLSDLPWVLMHNVVHAIEEFRPSLPASRTVLIGGALAIPVALLLHDTSDSWMPKTMNIPVLSFFARRWRGDHKEKSLDLTTFRNGLIFIAIAAVMAENEQPVGSMDYVADRLTNSTTRRAINSDMMEARRASFGAATQIAIATSDDGNAVQVRDAALRRRHLRETRAKTEAA